MLLPLPPLAARALDQARHLIAAGRLAEASAAAQQARLAAPNHPGVPAGVAEALAKKGLAREALLQRFLACRLAPEDPALRHALAAALPGADLTGASPAIQSQLVRLLHAPDVSPESLGPTILALLKTLPGHGLLALPGGLATHLNDPAVRDFLGHPLWLALLSRWRVTDRAVEELLTRLRGIALDRWREGQGGGFLTPALEPLAALALQADLTGHAWPQAPDERKALRQLQAQLEQTPPTSLDSAALLLACYRPLPATWQLAEPPGRGLLHAAWNRLLKKT